jgi:hypothetical protein
VIVERPYALGVCDDASSPWVKALPVLTFLLVPLVSGALGTRLGTTMLPWRGGSGGCPRVISPDRFLSQAVWPIVFRCWVSCDHCLHCLDIRGYRLRRRTSGSASPGSVEVWVILVSCAKARRFNSLKSLNLVGVTGFEPATPTSRT